MYQERVWPDELNLKVGSNPVYQRPRYFVCSTFLPNDEKEKQRFLLLLSIYLGLNSDSDSDSYS